MGYGYACARLLMGPGEAERSLSDQGVGAVCARPRQGFCYRYPYRCSRLKVEAFRADRAQRRRRHTSAPAVFPQP
jgi:hypothetical protein